MQRMHSSFSMRINSRCMICVELPGCETSSATPATILFRICDGLRGELLLGHSIFQCSSERSGSVKAIHGLER